MKASIFVVDLLFVAIVVADAQSTVVQSTVLLFCLHCYFMLTGPFVRFMHLQAVQYAYRLVGIGVARKCVRLMQGNCCLPSHRNLHEDLLHVV